jgi:hypothetical protein
VATIIIRPTRHVNRKDPRCTSAGASLPSRAGSAENTCALRYEGAEDAAMEAALSLSWVSRSPRSSFWQAAHQAMCHPTAFSSSRSRAPSTYGPSSSRAHE